MEESYVLRFREQYQQFSDLSLCCCGRMKCAPLHSCSPVACSGYQIHYIMDGRGSCCLEGQEHRLGKGEGFLIRPDQQVHCQADGEDPWTYLWVGFDGSDGEALLQALGLGGSRCTFRCRDGEGELAELIDRLLASQSPDNGDDPAARSLLCRFFVCLARSIGPEGSLTKVERENLYVQQAVEFIRGNYASGITVEEVARAVALDRSYLYTLFRRVLNISPRDYLARFRLTRAKELLIQTDAPIANISVRCGYQDPHVFSKAFRQWFGVTPSEFRRRERAEDGERQTF